MGVIFGRETSTSEGKKSRNSGYSFTEGMKIG